MQYNISKFEVNIIEEKYKNKRGQVSTFVQSFILNLPTLTLTLTLFSNVKRSLL